MSKFFILINSRNDLVKLDENTHLQNKAKKSLNRLDIGFWFA
jgi:hypothetical protein